ncbi:PAS domain S-box protein [Polaribacter tangerinus]|uniref:PAS domain-containing sensor histidine kinase n=1 Tax=Polaribacter tangerinus TaxID=1920034 RepID=UPI0030FC5D26
MVYDKDNKPLIAQGIVRDITGDRLAEESLKKSESRLYNIISNLETGILLEDEDGKIVLTNSQFCKLINIKSTPKELIGKDCYGEFLKSKDIFKDPTSIFKRIGNIISKKIKTLGEEIVLKDGTILERDFVPITVNNVYYGHLWSYKDVTLNRNYYKSLEIEKEKYRSTIANMNLGLLEVDLDDKIILANNSFTEISGYSQEELLGKVARDLLAVSDQKEVINNEILKREKGKSNKYEITILNKAGKKRIWLVSGAPNYNLKGELIGSIGIHLDITDLKNLEQQKAQMLQKLARSNQELEEYAHIVSHDLKSPLRSIHALLSWIKQDNLTHFDTQTLGNFDLLFRTVEKMESLITNVLEYSKVNANSVSNITLDLDELVKDCIEILMIPSHIDVRIIKKLPSIYADKTKIRQLFQNLISNAVKFSDKQKGYIEIDYKEKDAFYEFSIRDNGIGIKQKHFKNIFKVFQSLNPQKQSTGIGLSIVKKVVQIYGGEVWLTSTFGEGTTFYFTIRKE